nr:DMT family transporter [Myxococcota bacterium]
MSSDPAPSAARRGLAGPLFVLGAALLWGTLGVLSTAAAARGVAPLEIALVRALIGALLFAAHALVTRARFPRGRDLAWSAAFGLVGISLFYGVFQLALQAGGASLAVVLLYTAPALVALLAWGVLHERPTRTTVLLIACTIAGVALVSIGGGHGVTVSVASVAYGLVAGACYALYYLFGKTVLARNATSTTLTVVLGVGALGLVPFAPVSAKPLATWGLLAVIGLATSYLAIAAYAAGLRRMAPTRAAIIASFEPVIAVALAVVVLGEVLAPTAVAGAALVVGAVVL